MLLKRKSVEGECRENVQSGTGTNPTINPTTRCQDGIKCRRQLLRAMPEGHQGKEQMWAVSSVQKAGVILSKRGEGRNCMVEGTGSCADWPWSG